MKSTPLTQVGFTCVQPLDTTLMEPPPSNTLVMELLNGLIYTTIFWSFTRKNSKPFLPPGSSLKHYPLKKIIGEASHRKTIYSVPHKVKAFADDLSLIHSSPSVHQQELSATDSHCLDLDLVIRPDKCVSFVFDGSSMKSSSSFSLSSGQSIPIHVKPTKILGQTIGKDPSTTRSAAFSKLFINALLNINSWPIRGEYKAWILKHYLAPSLFFHLAVDKFSTTAIKQLQSQATKMLKKWLHLPMSTTLPVLFHPLVMKFPHLPSLRDKAILSMLALISSSSDQLVKEASLLLEDAKYANRQSIPAHVCPLLRAARVSISALQLSVSSRALKAATTKMINDYHAKIWDAQLERLKVQSKFQDIRV